jgi:energy-coupling factor transporter ATP-binding protein EcfA2
MKLAYIDLCGFRGYRKPIKIEFADGFTIIDGRNGVGKSTIFDAVEFALTGSLSKYNDAKASGETVADYIWWTGNGPAPTDRYVDVGFRDGDDLIKIRRTQFGKPDSNALLQLTTRLCDLDMAPEEPIAQLCSTSIIRDEHIAGLSLDLKETERYALLRDGLGANDADAWIARGSKLVTAAKQRSLASQQEVTKLNGDVTTASRRIDEVLASLVADSVVAEATLRLRSFSKSEVAPDQLAGPVRERIASVVAEIDSMQGLSSRWAMVDQERARLPSLHESRETVTTEVAVAIQALADLGPRSDAMSSSGLAKQARDLIVLANLGRQLGLQDGRCPLCSTGQDHDHFLQGIATAEDLAKKLDEEAAQEAEREQTRRMAETRLAAAQQALEAADIACQASEKAIETFDSLRKEKGIGENETLEQVALRIVQLRQDLESAQRDLRVLETLRLSNDLERAQSEEAHAKDRLALAQERAGRTRKAEAVAQALHDAARRAAGETLDRRLDRVLPLMSELYRRLRPHPVWRDIEYSIRGDVRRFLKLQVGDELNPQFLFSSGQRRATGLAFLLSVNLSLAWSRWRTIMLDDPVQHVDDFRTVHLAELAAQLVAEGRQIVCAVEDSALADLLCRRLPVAEPGIAKRFTLGPDSDGDLAVIAERLLSPMARHALLAQSELSAAT